MYNANIYTIYGPGDVEFVVVEVWDGAGIAVVLLSSWPVVDVVFEDVEIVELIKVDVDIDAVVFVAIVVVLAIVVAVVAVVDVLKVGIVSLINV